jgi:hypothetical protein
VALKPVYYNVSIRASFLLRRGRQHLARVDQSFICDVKREAEKLCNPASLFLVAKGRASGETNANDALGQIGASISYNAVFVPGGNIKVLWKSQEPGTEIMYLVGDCQYLLILIEGT